MVQQAIVEASPFSIRIMLVTGLRVQELIALSHQDIAEDGATIRVNKAIQMVNGLPNMGPPKSRNGYRSIPIPTQYRSSALYLKDKCGDSFLWRGRGDSPYYTVGSFRRRYYTEIEKMPNVRKLPPHCCRHTYITQLQAKGVPLETIVKLAGHGDMATTGIYLHLSADTLERAVDVLNTIE